MAPRKLLHSVENKINVANGLNKSSIKFTVNDKLKVRQVQVPTLPLQCSYMPLPMPHLVLQVTLEQRVPQSATAVKLEAANWELFCDYPRRVSPAATALLARQVADKLFVGIRQPVSLSHGMSAALAGCGYHIQAPGESLNCQLHALVTRHSCPGPISPVGIYGAATL